MLNDLKLVTTGRSESSLNLVIILFSQTVSNSRNSLFGKIIWDGYLRFTTDREIYQQTINEMNISGLQQTEKYINRPLMRWISQVYNRQRNISTDHWWDWISQMRLDISGLQQIREIYQQTIDEIGYLRFTTDQRTISTDHWWDWISQVYNRSEEDINRPLMRWDISGLQ